MDVQETAVGGRPIEPAEAEKPDGGGSPRDKVFGTFQWAGLVGGPLVFLIIILQPAPEGLSVEGWRTAGAALLMAIWWITEVVPISVTALLPLVLFPLLGIEGITGTAAPYANPMIFLFLGGFIIAIAMQRWGLHRRIALNIIRFIGLHPAGIIAGFMISSAFLSMWVSNTATTMMMLPIGLSVIELARPGSRDEESMMAFRHFAIVLMLAIAYASSIGGVSTLIGTPTNALMVGFMMETYGLEISFVQWMMVGLPVAILGLPLTFYALTRFVYPLKVKSLPGGREYINDELMRLGAISRPEKMVAFVFVLVAILWIFRPIVEEFLPGVSDAGVAIFGAILLFLLPVDLRKGVFVLNWQFAERLPWGVLILFGGGLTLAAAIARTGLAEWIGSYLAVISGWPLILVILIVATVIIMLTELTSNSATAAAFLPIMASVAIGIGQDPLFLVIPVTVAASCAFMLPVATPPNAIIYGSGVMTIAQMARAGLVLNVLFAIMITALMYVLTMLIFGIQPGVVPDWVKGV